MSSTAALAFSSSGCDDSCRFSGMTWNTEPRVTSDALIGSAVGVAREARALLPHGVLEQRHRVGGGREVAEEDDRRERGERERADEAVADELAAGEAGLRVADREDLRRPRDGLVGLPRVSWRASTRSWPSMSDFAQCTAPKPMPRRPSANAEAEEQVVEAHRLRCRPRGWGRRCTRRRRARCPPSRRGTARRRDARSDAPWPGRGRRRADGTAGNPGSRRRRPRSRRRRPVPAPVRASRLRCRVWRRPSQPWMSLPVFLYSRD